MITIRLVTCALALSLGTPRALAQGDPASSAAPSFDAAAALMQEDLVRSVEELTALRETIAAEKIPLTRTLNDLERELTEARAEFQRTSRLLDSRTLDLTNLRSDIQARQDETTYLAGLLADYVRNFESRLHIAELRQYEQPLEAAKLAPENSNLAQREVFRIQGELLAASLARLEDALGGSRFEGHAVVSDGRVSAGTFVLLGPSALFVSTDGEYVGAAEQRLGSLEPTQIPFADARDALAAVELARTGIGQMPVDTTLGNAHKIEATRSETWLEHVQKGGVVMIPIFAMAAIALTIALIKWIGLALVRKPSRKRVQALLDAVAERDLEAARDRAGAMRGPIGQMLAVGVAHLEEPRELIEEAMYEVVLQTRLRVQRFLPFIAICAASAPLLGLLGTVTGIINTFKMITVFGSGDVKSLSGGISEALITTKFGLIVAIPSLLLHAFLSRQAKSVTDRMETAGVLFTNQVARTPMQTGERDREPRASGEHSADFMQVAGTAPDRELVRQQVTEIVGELLGRIAAEDSGSERRNLSSVRS